MIPKYRYSSTVCLLDAITVFTVCYVSLPVFVSFSPEKHSAALTWLEEKYHLEPIREQKSSSLCQNLIDHIYGTRIVYSCPHNSPFINKGSEFQQKVWREISKIPYGETMTYGQLAKNIGSIGYARAVGQACHNNPLAIIIPCHRVVGTRGLGGFAGGIAIKERLLKLEQKKRGVTA